MNTEQVKTAFPTERDCMLFLIKKRELKTGSCAACGCMASDLKCYEERSCFVCCCNHFIYPRKDTIFENSKLPLQKWFLGIAYFNQHQKVTGQALSDSMSCASCSVSLSQGLEKLNVENYDISIPLKQVTVEFDEEKISIDKILATFKAMGFKGDIVDES
jgi:copper chaperone CopZ